MEEIAEQQTMFTQQHVKYLVTFILQHYRGTERKIQETQVRCQNRPDNNELAAPYTNINTNLTQILKF